MLESKTGMKVVIYEGVSDKRVFLNIKSLPIYAADVILDKMGLKSTVLLPLGYREEENDWLVKMKKVRNAKENFIVEFN